MRHPLPTPSLLGPGMRRDQGLPTGWAHSRSRLTCPTLARPLAGPRAGQERLTEPPPFHKPEADSRVLENKKPIQGAGPGGPAFRCMISPFGNAEGLPAGLVKPLMTHVQDTNHRPPGLRGLADTSLHGLTFQPRKGHGWVGPRAAQAGSRVSTLTASPGPTGAQDPPSTRTRGGPGP